MSGHMERGIEAYAKGKAEARTVELRDRIAQLEDELRRRLDPKVEEALRRVMYEARPFADLHWSRRYSPEQAKERLAEALEVLDQEETP